MARRRTLLDDFAAQARAKASSPALHYVDGAESLVLTYAQLISEACAVARGLILAGCGVGARVADFCDEGPAIALALLGIALAGGVVVPLDPALPAARLRSLLADADVSLLLCSAASVAALAAKLENSRAPLLALEAVGAAGDAPLPTPTPDALVHLIYTSGSTGAPKAVAVEHGALRAYGWAKIEAHGIRGLRASARLGAHVGPVHWRRLLDARRRRDALRRAARNCCRTWRARCAPRARATCARRHRCGRCCGRASRSTTSRWSHSAARRSRVASSPRRVVRRARRCTTRTASPKLRSTRRSAAPSRPARRQCARRARRCPASRSRSRPLPRRKRRCRRDPRRRRTAGRGYWRRDALTADRFVWLAPDEVRVVAEGRPVRYPEARAPRTTASPPVAASGGGAGFGRATWGRGARWRACACSDASTLR